MKQAFDDTPSLGLPPVSRWEPAQSWITDAAVRGGAMKTTGRIVQSEGRPWTEGDKSGRREEGRRV